VGSRVKGEYLAAAGGVDDRSRVDRHGGGAPRVVQMERSAYQGRARHAFGVVITGETRAYGNLNLKKGVTPLM